jgi:glycosyltransferase involved in cell wall biosynthesis
MRIVQIVSSISSINYGVWQAAIFGSTYLKKTYNVDSELWICTKTNNDTIEPEIPYKYFEKHQMSGTELKKWFTLFSKEETIFITHGAWLKPTFIGFKAKQAGFRWVYLSQGMFEPWALKNGWLKKKIYFAFFEKRMCRKADVIRAVSKPEEENLRKLFKSRICLIYNGVKFNPYDLSDKPADKKVFLFLARLHHKKGILPLVKGWSISMKGSSEDELLIVGPDEGELNKITPLINGNIKYYGALFGEEKKKMLQIAHYYVLPSFSEGFPSSVVEAMSFGAIPIISEGCNFPEVFKESLGYEVTTEEEDIAKVLRQVSNKPYDIGLARRNVEYVQQNLTESIIGDKIFTLYNEILK